MKSIIHFPPGRICIGLVILLAAAGWSLQAAAQDHGAGIRKSCPTPSKVGDTATCTLRVINEDEFGDSVMVTELWDLVGTGAAQFRNPPAGNLPIVEVTAGVACAPDGGAPIGLTFPCDLPGAIGGSGEYVRVASTYTVPEGSTDPLLDQANTVIHDECDVQPIGCNPNDQLLQFGAAVSLFEPSLEVTKTGPNLAKIGDEVCYSIGFADTSTGTGFPGFTGCTGTDDVLGDLGAFVAGQSREFCRTAQAGDPNPLVNTATITCGVVGFDNVLEDSDDHSVDLIDPSIEVTKTGPETAKIGDEFCWTISFAETGTGTLENCSGDDNFIGALGAFEAGVERDFCYTPDAQDPNPIVNTATITCDVAGLDNQVSDDDSHTTNLIDPAIEVTKTGPEAVKVGDEVCWDIGFSATGTGTLENCSGTDTFLGPLGAFEDGVTRNFCHTASTDDLSGIENTATITCDVAGFDNQASDSDSHAVEVIDPAIEVTKSGPEIAKVGDEVCWDIGFANTGTGALENCTGSDSFLGDLGAFDAGVDRQFCHTTTGADPNPIANTASITCDVVGFDNQVSDEDSHEVDLIDPAIEVTKTGPATAKVGDEVCWDIGFADTGTGDLENCTGSDTFLGALGAFEAGIDRQFCHTASGADPDPIENTATITCDVAGFDNQVSDDDSHTVDLIDPAVALTKLCRPDPVFVDETIYWDITVENTGDTTIDCLLNDAEAELIDEAFSLAAGESVDYTPSRTVLAEDYPLISNTATVDCAIGGFDNEVSDSDTADCEVRIPSDAVCRTPGFWGTHAGTEKNRSTNLTQLVIDAAGGYLDICGTQIDNTDVANSASAIEAMCVSIEGVQQRQLVRQLTAMALNCIVSGGDADCTGTEVDGLFAAANAACALNDEDLSDYIAEVDCFNNGGLWNGDLGECVVPPEGTETCHDRDLDHNLDIFDEVHPLPGPAGSSNACSDANDNDVYTIQ